MNKWQQTESGFIEMGSNGRPTGVVHPFTYHELYGTIIRVEHKTDGSKDIKNLSPRTIVMFDPSTGDIMGHNVGFSVPVEISGPSAIKVKKLDGTESESMEVSSLPADFLSDAGYGYSVDLKKKELVKKKEGGA